MNGLGGDIMVLVWDEDGQELHGYNGAGRAPAGQSLEDVREGLAGIGEEYIPMRGPLTVTVSRARRGSGAHCCGCVLVCVCVMFPDFAYLRDSTPQNALFRCVFATTRFLAR